MPPRTTDRKPRLSVERIVDVAIKQLREKGYESVTMRSIASELGTGQASLYAHIANRNELDSYVMGRISSMLVVPEPDPQHWDEQLTALAHQMLTLFREHPGTARCTMGNMPTSREALVPVEGLFAILRAGGIADQDASWFGDAMALYIASVAWEEDIWKARARAVNLTEEEAWDHIPDVFGSLDPKEFPVLTSMGEAMMTGDAEQRFAFGINLLITGLKSRT
jgi:AcrR family transcriptional regulator